MLDQKIGLFLLFSNLLAGLCNPKSKIQNIQKDIDSIYFPDYYGIEIKCTQRFSRYPVNLFSISFDGPRLYEMDRLLKKYGKSDKKYFNKLQLQGFIYVNKYNKINIKTIKSSSSICK